MTTRTSTGRSSSAERESTSTLAEAKPEGQGGETTIAQSVIAAIAGHVAQEVEGVVKLGARNIARTMADAVGGGDSSRGKGMGVDVEAGRREAVFDIEMTVEYGRPIPDIVRDVRESVGRAIREQAGLIAKEVNIEVAAIEFPKQEEKRGSRVE